MHIETAQFKRAFEAVRPVAESGSTLPGITGQVRLRSPEGGRLLLTTRDDAMEAVDAIACEGEELDICVPAARMLAVLLTAGPGISIEAKEGKAIVKSGRSRHQIACFPGADFPQIDVDDEVRAKFDATEMGSVLASVYWAAAKNDVSRPALNGVAIEIAEGRFVAVASDGGRLAMSRCPVSPEGGATVNAIISTISAQRVIALEPERVEARGSALIFTNGSRTLTVKTLATSYPNWRPLIQAPTGEIAVAREELLVAVNAAASYDDPGEAKLKKLRSVMLESTGTQLIVSSLGKADACRYEIEAAGYAFQAAYPSASLARALGESKDETVTLHLVKKDTGVAYLQLKEGEWRFVLAPMKV